MNLARRWVICFFLLPLFWVSPARPEDTYIVADWDTGRDLFEITPSGTIRRITQGVPWEQIRCLTMDAHGNIIVGVTIYKSGQNLDGIYRLNPQGVITPVVVGDEVPEPLSIAIDANGDYIVITQKYWSAEDPRLLRITPAGQITELHSGRPLEYPTDIAIDKQGHYVIVDRGSEGRFLGFWTYFKENGAIYRFDPNTKRFTTVLSALDENDNVIMDRLLGHLAGVAIDQDGNYIVVDSAPHLDSKGLWKTPLGNPSIMRVSPSGDILASYGVPTLDNVYPVGLGIGIGSDGNYIIADAVGIVDSSGRLLRMTPQGQVSTIILSDWMGQTGDVFVKRNAAPVVTLELKQPKLLPGGAFQFTLVGPPGAKYEIHASGDLMNWKPLRVVTLGATPTNIIDASSGLARRFYRAVQAP